MRLPSPVPGSSPAARCLVQNGRDAGSGHAMAPFCLLLPHALALRSSEMCHGRTPQAGHGRTPRLALSLAYRMVPRPHPSPTTRPRPHHRRPHRPQARHRCLTTLLWCRSAFLQALACQGCRAVHEGRIRVDALAGRDERLLLPQAGRPWPPRWSQTLRVCDQLCRLTGSLPGDLLVISLTLVTHCVSWFWAGYVCGSAWRIFARVGSL